MKNPISLVFLVIIMLLLNTCRENEYIFQEPELSILSEDSILCYRGDTLIINLYLNADAGIQTLFINDTEIQEIDQELYEQYIDYEYIISDIQPNGELKLNFLLTDAVGEQSQVTINITVISKDFPVVFLKNSLKPYYYVEDSIVLELSVNCPEGFDNLIITNQENEQVFNYSDGDNNIAQNVIFETQIPFLTNPGDSALIFSCEVTDKSGQKNSPLLHIPVKIIDRDLAIDFYNSDRSPEDIALQMIIKNNVDKVDIYGYGSFTEVNGDLIPSYLTSIFVSYQDKDDGVVVLYEDYGKPKYFYQYNRKTKVKGDIMIEIVFLPGDSTYFACYEYDWDSQVGTFNSGYILGKDNEDYLLIQTSLAGTDLKSKAYKKSLGIPKVNQEMVLFGPCGILEPHCDNSPLNWATTINAEEWRDLGKKMILGGVAVAIVGPAGAVTGAIALVGIAAYGIGEIIDIAHEAIKSDKKSFLEDDFCNNIRKAEDAPAEAIIPGENTGFMQSNIDEEKLQADPCSDVSIGITASMDMEGSILVIPSGGADPYKYSVDMSSPQGSQVFPNNYEEGTYLIGIIDGNGCSNYKSFSLTKDISEPYSITMVSGNNQSGDVGTQLSSPLKVQVKDGEGNGYEGSMVTFSVTSGSGALSSNTVSTDANGYAQTSWTLGSITGMQTVECYAYKFDGTYLQNAPLTFTASAELNRYSSFIDSRDGHEYKAVQIGTQVWMAENLAYEGAGQQIISDSAWINNHNYDGWCYYDNDKATFGSTYGVLYQWEVAKDVCPTGWHLPSNAEWAELVNYLLTIGDKNGKSLAATSGWTTSSIVGTVGNDQSSNNSTGFSAFPGGLRNGYGGDFNNVGNYVEWWVSTEYSAADAYSRILSHDDTDLAPTSGNKGNGVSVRCLRD